jgi:hypothetical protein
MVRSCILKKDGFARAFADLLTCFLADLLTG